MQPEKGLGRQEHELGAEGKMNVTDQEVPNPPSYKMSAHCLATPLCKVKEHKES